MLRSFRLRITLWYLALFSLLFVVFSAFLYTTLDRALLQRLDETLSAESRTAAALFAAELQELNGDERAAAAEAMAELRVRGVDFALLSPGGLLAASGHMPREVLAEPAIMGVSDRQESFWPVPAYGSVGGRGIVYRFEERRQSYRVIAVAPLNSIAEALTLVRRFLYFGLPLLFGAAGLGGFWLASRSVKPLKAMADQAAEISSWNLNRRLEVGSATEELEALTRTFNELLARLDNSFETMRRFTADASHEMRTPLSIIRGEAEVALGQDRSSGEYRDSLAVIHDEAVRLSRLVDDLLNLARADAGHVRLRVSEFYLNDLLAECCRAMRAAAEAGGLSIDWHGTSDTPYRGDEELLRRMVLNLIDNAIRYTAPGGKVDVKLELDAGNPRIVVSDTGIGIPAEAAPHVFERFYRADAARSRKEGGFGLGLSIVKWIAECHRGVVSVNTVPGAGSTFTVLLPR
jgi:heavy metal sensor kinase